MHLRESRLPFLILAIALLSLTPAASLPAQLRVQPVGELPGEASLNLMLRKLASVGTFMQTAAHPDDEDNALLAELGLGQGMRTVLVTATRGDGGQNEIGPEIFQSLGVLRTEELLAAHRFDGAEQLFTRAVDFGFSFSVEESLEKWGHDEILGDFVYHIRATRPDVIAGFICGGEGGGQHHQASARLTVEAFRAAADPERYPEHLRAGLRPWQAKRVFCTDFSGFGPRAKQQAPAADLLTVRSSGFDPVIGRTYSELGIEARSMHKCQGTAQLLPLPGADEGRTYRIRDSAIGTPGVAPKTLFEGIDTRLTALAQLAGPRPPDALVSALAAIAGHVDAASQASRAAGQGAASPPLAAGLTALRALRAKLATTGLAENSRYEIDFRLARKEQEFQKALALSHGIRVEAIADDGLVVAGQPVKVALVAAANAGADASLRRVSISGFDGQPPVCTGALARGAAVTCEAALRVPARARTTTPYWQPRTDAARYDFEPDVPFGAPFRPSPFRATFELSIAGADVTIEQVVQYRYSDLMAGEKRMELSVVPAYAVRANPGTAVIPAGAVKASGGAAPSRTVAVTVVNHEKAGNKGTVTVQVPAGWRATPASASVAFTREDESATVAFSVTPSKDAQPGEFGVRAFAERAGGVRSDAGYTIVEYPHIRRRHVVEPAHTRVKVIDVTLQPGLQVGYIMGVGDHVPEAIEQLGAAVHLIEPEELAGGDLSRYNVIVTGVRAYERRPDLRANNHRLLTYVEAGGTVLVNYNKFEFNEAPYGPFPAKVTSDRVTDENAPVDVLVPDSPVFTTPNRLGAPTWAGWVQERGTYFLSDKDPRYVDLVRLTDPFPFNARPKTGALVHARHGKGHWVYLGLGLWRQLPAGTDGAYQLLANLLSLGGR